MDYSGEIWGGYILLGRDRAPRAKESFIFSSREARSEVEDSLLFVVRTWSTGADIVISSMGEGALLLFIRTMFISHQKCFTFFFFHFIICVFFYWITSYIQILLPQITLLDSLSHAEKSHPTFKCGSSQKDILVFLKKTIVQSIFHSSNGKLLQEYGGNFRSMSNVSYETHWCLRVSSLNPRIFSGCTEGWESLRVFGTMVLTDWQTS